MLAEPWTNLNIGDQIQMVERPLEVTRESCHEETCALYDWLVLTAKVLKIVKIESGVPVAQVVQIRDGREFWEYIGINHGGWTRV